MPELPEVEAVAQALRRLIEGETIVRCRVIHRVVVQPSPGGGKIQAAERFARRVWGEKVRAVGRRGKYLILCLGHGTLIMHFRFDGQLIWFDSNEVSGHVDVTFETSRGTLGYVDPRHLGRVQWASTPEDVHGIRALGVEPLSRGFTVERLAEMLRASRQPLKLFLLDQKKVAGIGNIYASEALWRAKLDPRRRTHRLTGKEARRLHKSIVEVLHRALECCQNPAPDFRDPKWWFQGLERILRVYGREGESCRTCGEAVRRIEQGGRSTYFCARCQR
jgi:formamidopyrimidine-DNA glycosylase